MNIIVDCIVALVLGGLIGWVARGGHDRQGPDQAGQPSVTEVDGVSLASVTDPMTGLFNRQGYRLLAARLLRDATRERRTALLMLFDIDGLRAINDRLGHAVGDDAIRSVAALLQATFRDTDLVARIDGDEFCVMGMLPGTAGDGSAQLGRLDEAVTFYNEREGAPFRLGLSSGLATWDPRRPTPLETLEQEADRRLYADKVLRGFHGSP
jgi:diguanylate cyclase (GGDEF)-like protein